MTIRVTNLWFWLIGLVGLLSLIYLWYTVFPGRIPAEAGQYFTSEQISKGRHHSQIQQLLFISSFVTQFTFLLWLLLSGRARAISKFTQTVTHNSYISSAVIFFIILWVMINLINLPFKIYGSYYLQQVWGFSTQTLGQWWLDYFKGAALDLVLSTAGVIIFFAIARSWPRAWWLIGALLLSVWLIVQNLLWPVLVSPLFNKFEQVKDPQVLNMVEELSHKAGIDVGEVLIMDASSRTTKANAYFTGVGHTKRIVLYDTLLDNYPPDQVKAVVAHEMAHWRQGHIVKGLFFGILGTFMAWGLLFLLIRSILHYNQQLPPYTWTIVLLFLITSSFLTSPLQNYISRGMEREADIVSVSLTGDAAAAMRLQLNLATKNVSDIAPPAYIEWFSYSHPSVLNRISAIKLAGK